MAATIAEPSAERALAFFAGSIRRRWEHGHDIVAIDAHAATADPGVRADVEQVVARRRGGIARVAASLAPALSHGIGVARATAIVDALTLLELYRAFATRVGPPTSTRSGCLGPCDGSSSGADAASRRDAHRRAHPQEGPVQEARHRKGDHQRLVSVQGHGASREAPSGLRPGLAGLTSSGALSSTAPAAIAFVHARENRT